MRIRSDERFNDPLVMAARRAFEQVWIDLGRPSPLKHYPELSAARKVYHAVLDAHEMKLLSRGQKLEIVK
jgi:hypothetical protein